LLGTEMDYKKEDFSSLCIQ